MIGFILCAAFVAIFVSTSALPVKVLQRRYFEGPCSINGIRYNHSDVFHHPGLPYSKCVKHRCFDGGVSLHEEGCEINGICIAVDSTYKHTCMTHKCFKITKPSDNSYIVGLVKARCMNSEGRCYVPGKEFSFIIKGKLYRSCTCSMNYLEHRTSYKCRSASLSQ